jgi:hypothetical protein
VTLAATVSANAPGAGTRTGTIQFKVDGVNFGSPVVMSGGSASISTSTLSVSPHSINASYSGDGNFDVSTATTFAQTVDQGSSTTTVTSSANPSVSGQSVTFTATVAAAAPSSGTPTGTVTFKDGASTLGTGTLNGAGQATISTSTLTVASHAITAVYGGNSNFLTSTSTVLAQAVNQDSTTTGVTSSANPSVSGQSVTFTATVTANAPGSGTPTGTVQFKIDGVNSGSPVAMSGGSATSGSITSLSVGAHTISAVYSGDSSFTATTGTLTQTVNNAPTSTLVGTSVNPSNYGQSVTFTATVSTNAPGSGTPTGTVTFKDGASTLGTGTLNGAGQATYSTSLLSGGSHSISAVYSGSATHATSTGSLPTQTVTPIATKGFYQPVSMTPPSSPLVLNTVKAGSTVPLKFNLYLGSTTITDTSYVSAFTSSTVRCDSDAVMDPVDFTTSGNTGLRWDSTAGQFINNWKTPSKAGSCIDVTMTAIDGTSIQAHFKLT